LTYSKKGSLLSGLCVTDLSIMKLHPGTPLVRKLVNDVLTIVALADDVMGS